MFSAGARISGIHFPSKVVPRLPKNMAARPRSPSGEIAIPPTERTDGAAGSVSPAVRSNVFPTLPSRVRLRPLFLHTRYVLSPFARVAGLSQSQVFFADNTPRISYLLQLSRTHSSALICAAYRLSGFCLWPGKYSATRKRSASGAIPRYRPCDSAPDPAAAAAAHSPCAPPFHGPGSASNTLGCGSDSITITL